MKSKLSIFLALLIVAALGIGGYYLLKNWKNGNLFGKNKTEVVVELDGQTQKELSVSLTDFYPGCEDKTYTIVLKAKEAGEYSVSLTFAKTGDVGLAPYVDVELYGQEKTLAEGKLSEFLNGKKTSIKTTLAAGETQEIKVTYGMGLEIGDEAQGQIADFKIVVTTRE